MADLAELKEKATRIKSQIEMVTGVFQDLTQKAFMTEEILWDLKRNHETTQREIFSILKGLDGDEKLAYQAGISVAEVRLAKSLLKKVKKIGKPNGQKV